jgi:predicted Zn-dependent protease
VSAEPEPAGRVPELAGRVLELARAAVGPAAEAEVLVEHAALALTRFANSYIHQNVTDSVVTVRLRLHVDGRTAAGSTTVVTDDGLRALAARTVAGARLCPPDPGWPGLTAPTPLTRSGGWDDATALAGPDERADRVRAFVDAAGGLVTAGYCRTAHRAAAFVNSAGQSVAGRGSEAAMDGIARAGGADGAARLSNVSLAGIDGAVLGARAAAKAAAGTERVELPPGRYEVVLEPPAVADILANLALYGFNGKAYAERKSFAEPGVRQFDRAVTLVDGAAGGPALPFDAEGTPRGAHVLVDAGLTRAVTHDRRSAAECGVRSTGHAQPGGSLGPTPTSLSLTPADGAPAPGGPDHQAVDPATAGLLVGVERGLLITDLWYTRVLDPKTLVVTGLTRNGVWLVERGEITAAVRDLRFTQSYPDALAPGAVRGVGTLATPQPDGWGATAWWSAPAVHLASWNFTGGASG